MDGAPGSAPPVPPPQRVWPAASANGAGRMLGARAEPVSQDTNLPRAPLPRALPLFSSYPHQNLNSFEGLGSAAVPSHLPLTSAVVPPSPSDSPLALCNSAHAVPNTWDIPLPPLLGSSMFPTLPQFHSKPLLVPPTLHLSHLVFTPHQSLVSPPHPTLPIGTYVSLPILITQA